MAFNRRWAPYVPVATRRANAAREASKLSKKGKKLRPIEIKSRAIATSFWGMAWCGNLEIYSDWANRLPRGRAYARNGSIVDLQIETGTIEALVSGSSLYRIKIRIEPLNSKRWQAIRSDCARQVTSLLDLMRGKLPDVVLARLTDPKEGMFPSPKELKMQCSCPDYATMCKHVAATLYGVGHLLDSEPELFFKMRGVDRMELVSDAIANQSCDDAIGLNEPSDLQSEDLGAIFGIDLSTTTELQHPTSGVGNMKSKEKQARKVEKPFSKSKSTVKPKRQMVSVTKKKKTTIGSKKTKLQVERKAESVGSDSAFSKTTRAKIVAKSSKRVKKELTNAAPEAATKKPKRNSSKRIQSQVAGTHKKPAVGVDKTRKIKSS